MTTIYKLIERVNVNFNDTQDSTNFIGNERFFSLESINKFIEDNDLHKVNVNGLGSEFSLDESDLGYVQGWLVSPEEYSHKPEGFEALLDCKPEIIGHLQAMCDVPTDIAIVSIQPLHDGAKFMLFDFDGERQAAVYYPDDDMLFAPTDWQNGYPANPDEIEDYQWHNSAGDDGIVVCGLPRAFTAYRDEQRKEFGQLIKAKRESLGLTLADLSKRTGLLRQNICRIECGRYNVTLDTITRLRAALGEL